MNFTNEIRRDLLSVFPAGKKNMLAVLAAFMATGAARTEDGFAIVSENERVAEYVLRLAEAFGVRMEIGEVVRDPKRRKDKLTLVCSGEEAVRLLAAADSHVRKAVADRESALWYLRAAFLGGGSCTLPHGEGAKTGYHLECVFSDLTQAEYFCNQLSVYELFGKIVARGDSWIAYVKSREAISDVLSVLGANGALRRLERVSAEREENNNKNRVQNCASGNADRAAIASAAQAVAFQRLEKSGRFAALPEALRKTARARLEHPTMSLSELAALLGVSKGGLGHRLRRLMQYCSETGECK